MKVIGLIYIVMVCIQIYVIKQDLLYIIIKSLIKYFLL